MLHQLVPDDSGASTASLSSGFFAPLSWIVAAPGVSLKRTLLRMPGQVFTPLKATDFAARPS